MAQTSTATNTVNGVIHISADGSTWTDISGSTNKVEAPSQEADLGEAATLEGNYKIGTAGKFKPLDITVTILYTETATEAYTLLAAQADLAGSPLWLRWSSTGLTGSKRYTTGNSSGVAAAGRITSRPFPGADASDANPTLLVFKVRCTTLVTGTVTPSASMSPSASLSPSASASASASKSA